MSAQTEGCPRCAGTGWVWLTVADRAAEVSCPDCCGPSAQAVLDWREAHRWLAQTSPCRYCGRPTHLRDDELVPAHKVCAATALTAASATPADTFGGVA